MDYLEKQKGSIERPIIRDRYIYVARRIIPCLDV